MFVAFSTVGLCFNLLYRVVYFLLVFLFCLFFILISICLFGKPVCHIPALLCFLFVCLFVFKSLCSLRKHFFYIFAIAWTFQELQGAETSLCLPVKGVSSLKVNSLLKKS